jgi:hypothetical protein
MFESEIIDLRLSLKSLRLIPAVHPEPGFMPTILFVLRGNRLGTTLWFSDRSEEKFQLP